MAKKFTKKELKNKMKAKKRAQLIKTHAKPKGVKNTLQKENQSVIESISKKVLS